MWAFKNGCKLDTSVTASCLNGNLEMLALLIRSKCPYMKIWLIMLF